MSFMRMSSDFGSSMGKSRAIMTDTERERLAGLTDVADIKVYQAKSRVRRRIDEELTFDVEILAENHPDLLAELREVVCEAEDDERQEPEVRGLRDDHTPDPEPDPGPRSRAEADVDRLRDELAGSGDLLDRRVEAILDMYDYLVDHGEAEKSDLLGAVDVDATGYASEDSVWANMVKGCDTLRALPGVETPRTGMTTWKYTGER